MPAPTHCPLCDGPGCHFEGFWGFTNVDCPRCGKYQLDDSYGEAGLPRLSARERAVLAILARRRTDTDPSTLLQIAWTSAPELISSYRQPDVARRRQRLLEHFAQESKDAGDHVSFDAEALVARLECTSADAVTFLLETLEASGLVKRNDQARVVVTADGWQAVSLGGTGVSGTCFIAMSFAEEHNPVRDAIERAVVRAQLNPLRVDRVEHNGNINEFILTKIREAEVMVADFTDHRAGVYYEAGFAFGLGRQVVYTCRKDHFEKTHFDTRAINHIVWDSLDELEARLVVRLQNTVPSLLRG